MQTKTRAGLVVFGILLACILAWFSPLSGTLLGVGLGGWAVAVLAKPTRASIIARALGVSKLSRSAHVGSAVGEILLGLVLMVLVGAGVSARNTKHLAEEKRIADTRREAAEKSAALRDADLRAHASEAAEQAAQALKVVATSLEGQDLPSAKQSLQTADSIISKYQRLNPPLPAFIDLARNLHQDKEDLAVIDNAKNGLFSSTGQLVEAANKVKEKDFIAADNILDEILRKLDVPERVAHYLPMKEVKKVRGVVEARKRALAPRVKQQQGAVAAAEVYRKICGEAPKLSAWDGEVIGLEHHIKQTAHDPSSIDVENRTEPRFSDKNCWVSTCDVRGKNAFGALILQRHTYSFSKLGIEQLR
jgi:hypothetical protein